MELRNLYEVYFANMGMQQQKIYNINKKNNKMTIVILILMIVMIGIVRYQVPVIKQVNTRDKFTY